MENYKYILNMPKNVHPNLVDLAPMKIFLDEDVPKPNIFCTSRMLEP